MEFVNVPICIKEQKYESPSEWRKIGASAKAEHITRLCNLHNIVPDNVLEVGAGDGAILNILAAQNFCQSFYALEISGSGVEVINKQHIPGLVNCSTFNGYTLDFPDDFFDVVYLSHVLEHVEYERALLREVLRVGKYHIIEVPLDIASIKNDGFGISLLPSYGHINVYSPDLLKFLLRSEGFYIINDILGRPSFEVISYFHFNVDGNTKTESNIQNLFEKYTTDEKNFNALSREEQERKSSFYTVLTRKITKIDYDNMHKNNMLYLIRNNRRHEAMIILNAFYSGDEKKIMALAIAKSCIKKKYAEADFFLKLAENL